MLYDFTKMTPMRFLDVMTRNLIVANTVYQRESRNCCIMSCQVYSSLCGFPSGLCSHGSSDSRVDSL